jgi:ATPase subunit of ABC transporter with duplicated ATPase domains
MRALVEVSDATIVAPGGRPLFDGLSLRLSREHVALVGRNGVGKSMLLSVLAGAAEAQTGRVKTSSPPHFVPQAVAPVDARARTMSHGELRKLALAEARSSGAEILLLDEARRSSVCSAAVRPSSCWSWTSRLTAWTWSVSER